MTSAGTGQSGGGNGSLTTGGGSGTTNTGSGGGGGAGAAGGNGGSGIIILRYASEYIAVIGAGLTGTTEPAGLYKVTTITQGTGNITFSE
jgi:hypothetical protein